MNIYLTATLNSKPEFTEEVKAVLQTMVSESQKKKRASNMTCIKE